MGIFWMIIVGGLIGLVASMFVRGSRTVGLAWTIILGALGYGLGGGFVYAMGGSVLLQWIVAIILTAFLLTGYILMANKRSRRRGRF